MVVFQSIACLAVLLAGLVLAVLCGRGLCPVWTGFFSMLCASALIVLILLAGGTLQEGLAWLLPMVWLLLPAARRKLPADEGGAS